MEDRSQMQEKIGKVTLDYRFYPGEDTYSDGGIEDEMLELAKLYGGGDYSQVIAEKKNWPILYHFSHVRGNIIEWLPMTGQERVLEIGAGPGAVTGILAGKAKSVTCIDLSKRRSLINAYRNRDRENIRILVGNFQDVAESLEEKFDLITLIGVFEYAQFSIQSPDPFADYLLAVRRLLAPGGRLVVAIENRLGLKYWAGAAEDHTGVYFEGLEGYPTTDYVRTFAKPELENLFAKSKFAKWEFYYPYPDYKLPERIYSDRCLPRKGELNRNAQNFDRQRMQVFSEEKVYDSLVGSGLYPLYANSFFVVAVKGDEVGTAERTAAPENEAGFRCGNTASEDEAVFRNEIAAPENEALFRNGIAAPEDEAVFRNGTAAPERDAASLTVIGLKYSNERDPRFRIRTDILEYADKSRVVRKTAADPRAAEHIASIGRKYQELAGDLEGTGLFVNRCRMENGDAYLEWLEGPTLEEELDEQLFAGRTEQVIGKIRDYFSLFEDGGEEFRETDGFVQVFGKCPQGEDGQKSRKISDIDMIFSNVIRTDRGYELIDYEWTFDFPVPAGFLKYRCLNYYIYGNTRREELLGGYDLFAKFGITPRMRQWFDSMETRFQQYMLGEYQPAWKLYDAISEGVIPVQPLVREASAREKVQPVEVWFDRGNGFCEEDSRRYRPACGEKRSLTIALPAGTRAVKAVLGGRRSVVRIEKMEQAGRALPCETAGHRAPNGDYLFDDAEAEFVIPRLWEEDRPVEIAFYREPLEGILRETALAQDGRIRWMEQTKVWRLYRKVKKLFGARGSEQ